MSIRSTCFKCERVWGYCECENHSSDDEGYGELPGFEFEGTWIVDPHVDPTGRFFVEPEEYYGDAYRAFVAGCKSKEIVVE